MSRFISPYDREFEDMARESDKVYERGKQNTLKKLKIEMIAMLKELQSEIEEMDSREHECNFATPWCIDKGVVVEIIQEKINALGGANNE